MPRNIWNDVFNFDSVVFISLLASQKSCGTDQKSWRNFAVCFECGTAERYCYSQNYRWCPFYTLSGEINQLKINLKNSLIHLILYSDRGMDLVYSEPILLICICISRFNSNMSSSELLATAHPSELLHSGLKNSSSALLFIRWCSNSVKYSPWICCTFIWWVKSFSHPFMSVTFVNKFDFDCFL